MGEPLAAIRRVETTAAAEVVGVRDIEWLGYRDGYVEYTLDLRRDIARIFRKYRPHRFVVMDPTSRSTIGSSTTPTTGPSARRRSTSLTAGTTPGHFPELLDEGLEPWRGLRETWIMGPGRRTSRRRHLGHDRPQDRGADVPREPGRRDRATVSGLGQGALGGDRPGRPGSSTPRSSRSSPRAPVSTPTSSSTRSISSR